MLGAPDAAYLEQLRIATAKALREAIGPVNDVALLDVPNQRNVGDSLIWAGETAYFARLGLRLRYAADLNSYNPESLRRAMPSGVVLLHGGGNFGDLWLGHQRHREQIVRDLPDYSIVQLPQSIYFQSKDRAALANDVVGAHPNFRLMIRDKLSIQRAAEDLPKVDAYFCHDMAFGWEPPALVPQVGETPRILVIAREDKEKSSNLGGIGDDWIPGSDILKTDWHNSGWDARRWQVARRVARGHHSLLRARSRGSLPAVDIPNRIVRRVLSTINEINISGALKLYAPAKVVVADRLHAHVLAVLLGIDHVVLDNNYRKLSAVYEDYSGHFTSAHYATDIDDARSLTEELVAR